MQRKASLQQHELALSVTPEVVRIEKNLLQIGFFSAARADKPGEGPSVRRIEQWITRGDKRIKVAAEFRSSVLGLPRTPDRDKFLAFMHVVAEQKSRQGRLSNPIQIAGARMLKLLGQTDAGRNYEELAQWGKRMADTTITSEQVIYFAAHRKFIDDTIHVFRRFTVQGSADNASLNQSAVFYTVVVEDWLLDNINESYYVPIDFVCYKKLSRPIAKAIYNHLYYWFFAIRKTTACELEKDYGDLCTLLDIVCHTVESKVRQQLAPAFQELIDIGYVKKWDIRPMISKVGWKLVIAPGGNLLKFIQSNQRKELPAQGTSQASLNTDQERVLSALLDLGVDDSKALVLAKKYDPETTLLQLDYINEVVAGSPGRIKNIPGFAIKYIEDLKPVPRTFVSTEEKKRRYAEAEMKRDKREQENRTRVDAEIENLQYQAWCMELALNHIHDNVPAEDLRKQLKRIEDGICQDDRRMADMIMRLNPKSKKESLTRELAKAVLQEMTDLPTVEEWRKMHNQACLFVS